MFTRCGVLQKGVALETYRRYLCAMLIGDARVSTSEQETAAQVTALKALT